jgi:hypothetical protein
MFDYKKLKTSALIMLGGILVSGLPTISKNVIDIIQTDATFDWKTPTVLTIGAVSTWIVATVRNYINFAQK